MYDLHGITHTATGTVNERRLTMETITGVWECATCGRDNPLRAESCILCGGARHGCASEVDESAAAADLIRAAEEELSREMGEPIRLKVFGRPSPSTIAEAEARIAEARADLRELLAEAPLGLGNHPGPSE
jgi:hypothetical protein